MLEKLEYELEFITPAFVGGAERKTAELRPASIVGMLRWWWRQLNWNQNYRRMFDEESFLFGSQNKAASLWVRVKEIERKMLNRCEPVRESWKVYLGFGNVVYVSRKYERLCGRNLRGRNVIIKPYLEEGLRASLEFLVHSKLKDKVEDLLFVVSQLGALGSRSRRGWGNFYLRPKEGSRYSSWDSWNKEELKRAIKEVSGKDLKDTGIELYKVELSCYSPTCVLEKIGDVYRDFRNRRNPDYQNLKKFLKGQPNSLMEKGVERAYFGLPIIFRFNSLGRKFVTVSSPNNRLASPVMFRVVREGREFSLLIIRTKNFVPPSFLKLEEKRIPFPGDAIFDKFLEFLRRRLGKPEVIK